MHRELSSIVCGTALLLASATAGAQEKPEAEAVPPEKAEVGGPLSLSRPDGATDDFSFKGAETPFNVDPVLCDGTDIGQLDFLFRPSCDAGYDPGLGGASLEGGFTAHANDPCDPGDQHTGVEYSWVQIVKTSHPLKAGVDPFEEYVDAPAPRANPCYPFKSDDNNPANNPFTGMSFYDGPSRYERTEDISWSGELMLVCKRDNSVEVIGAFHWGFEVEQDATPDSAVTVTATAPFAWGDATDSALATVAEQSRGNGTEMGWSVSRGCCCKDLEARDGESDATGLSSFTLESYDPGLSIDRVVVSPRNHQVIDLVPGAPGWNATLLPVGSAAPLLPFQTIPSALPQNGILFTPAPSTPNNVFQTEFSFFLEGHESFFDLFVYDASSGHWRPFAVRTQQLLGDMNGDSQLTPADLELWDLAFDDPTAYGLTFPQLDRIYGGDLNHDGMLDAGDRALLEIILEAGEPTDATAIDSSIFTNGFESGDVSAWTLSEK